VKSILFEMAHQTRRTGLSCIFRNLLQLAAIYRPTKRGLSGDGGGESGKRGSKGFAMGGESSMAAGE
jgi:uncharacterized membrane protein YgcG